MGHRLRPPIKIHKISTNSVQNVKCHNYPIAICIRLQIWNINSMLGDKSDYNWIFRISRIFLDFTWIFRKFRNKKSGKLWNKWEISYTCILPKTEWKKSSATYWKMFERKCFFIENPQFWCSHSRTGDIIKKLLCQHVPCIMDFDRGKFHHYIYTQSKVMKVGGLVLPTFLTVKCLVCKMWNILCFIQIDRQLYSQAKSYQSVWV